ncbi:HAD family hydrolase [Georgenia sp. 311]|uniref:HAD family hydrolase n=1 Tax=Georgenia wutianyii TaxID=2585135 RepID=A0ABX5VQH4_9MICO|nr:MULTISPECIES: HAD family hydrolase [Georgenia]QDB80520.1 HAD family hydrolase [Georgenia wutianyii]TNC18267.1 HAD family hydrolase [Georgenia sp. 311]
MPTDAPGAVLLDIDGTLADSNYVHTFAWTRAFREVGHPVDAWRIHRRIGMGGSLLLAELLGDRLEELGERAEELHTRYYAEAADELHRFDGVPELVRALKERGVRVVLATSAAPEELEILERVLGIVDDVDAVTSAGDVEEAKPDPDIVRTALDAVDVPADRAVFVGDTVWDVEAAARAGVPCVGVLTGGISEAELTGAGAVAVYDSVADLLVDLDASPLRHAWEG